MSEKLFVIWRDREGIITKIDNATGRTQGNTNKEYTNESIKELINNWNPLSDDPRHAELVEDEKMIEILDFLVKGDSAYGVRDQIKNELLSKINHIADDLRDAACELEDL